MTKSRSSIILALSVLALAVLAVVWGCSNGGRNSEIITPQPTPQPEYFKLFIQSATIAKSKKDGRAWDGGFGKLTWPDPYVKVRVFDTEGGLVDAGETNSASDTFTPVWNQELAKVKEGWTVKLEVWDKDIQEDDEIGKYELKITAEVLKTGEVSLQFEQVENLKLELRPVQKPQETSRILLQQPHPGPHSANHLKRSNNCDLAIVLLHGLGLRNDGCSPREPQPQGWQGSTSPLVRGLAKHGDVFAVSYSQTAPVEEIATLVELRDAIEKIKRLGYREVVLMAHSAGGLLARHFVEETSHACVARVIQVATPNAGAHLAELGFRLGQIPREQEPFVRSLTPTHRTALLRSRQGRTIPLNTDFVSVIAIAVAGVKGDNTINGSSQWPVDLQQQGVPCIRVQATHMDVMVHDETVKVLCTLASQRQPRWSRDRIREKAEELRLALR